MLKKGQITAFIIIGIVIAASIGIVMYLRNRGIGGLTEEEIVTSSEVSAELLPVDSLVKSCIVNLAEQGIKTAEEHGGYIDLEGLRSGIASPTDGNALEYIPNSGILIPYWYYMESSDECQSGCSFNSMIPPLCKPSGRSCVNSGANSVELQLETYIEKKIKECLNNFTSIRRAGFEIGETGEPDVDVTIRNGDILLKLNYPLSIKQRDSIAEVNNFITTLRSDFQEMYATAYDITHYEMGNCFIGMHTQNYLSYFMGIDAGQLPPTYRNTMGETDMRMWNLYEVKEVLKLRFMNAMQVIGVFNTAGFEWPIYADRDDPYYDMKQGILDRRVFKPFKEYRNVAVTLSYLPWWEPYITILPNNGGILKPTNMGPNLGFVGSLLGSVADIKNYEFSYQYSFPVAVDIRKVDYTGKEHVFRFALETNVRANRCFNSNITLTKIKDMTSGLVCSDLQATKEGKIMTKEVVRRFGRDFEEPLDKVKVSFSAGKNCLTGYTDENGELDVKYPPTLGGTFILNKAGYADKTIDAYTVNNNRNVVIMDKIIEVPATVKKYKIGRDLSVPSSPSGFLPSEKAIIAITKVDEPSIPVQVVIFTGGQSQSNIPLKLIPGTYETEITYTNSESVITPRHCCHVCEDSWGCETSDSWDFATKTPVSGCNGDLCADCCTDTDQWFPDSSQEVQLLGGAKLNEANGYWIVPRLELLESSSIEFNVIVMADPDCITTESCIIPGCVGYAEEVEKLENYYTSNRGKLEPKFVFS